MVVLDDRIMERTGIHNRLTATHSIERGVKFPHLSLQGKLMKSVNLECNTHASSFVKGDKHEEFDDVANLLHPLNLNGEFKFKYSYPLSQPAHFVHTLTPEMTGEDILVLARKDYETIYNSEDDPGHISGMLNRATSEGPYGIWGHDFSDLYFEGVDINILKKHVEFSMGS